MSKYEFMSKEDFLGEIEYIHNFLRNKNVDEIKINNTINVKNINNASIEELEKIYENSCELKNRINHMK